MSRGPLEVLLLSYESTCIIILIVKGKALIVGVAKAVWGQSCSQLASGWLALLVPRRYLAVVRHEFLRPLILVTLVLGVVACSGGGSGTPDETTPALAAVTVASGMNPSPDGFAFPNFASSASTAELDAADMVTMFGSTPDICVDATTPCVLTSEASAWARMVNQARVSGHCEGLAVLSAARFTDKLDPKTFTLTNTGDVTHALIRAFATQFFKETQDATKKFSKKSPSDIVAILSASLKNGLEYTLGVYSDIGGHAILPIGVEFPSADVAHIKVYDSNWPNADRFVEVNLKKETWSFAFSGADPANDPDAWTGGKGDIDITPFSARISATCPFCGDKSGVQKSLLLVRSALPNWSIETADGIITPDSSDIGDSSVRPVRAGVATSDASAPTDYLVSTTIGASGVKMFLGSTARVSGLTPNAVFEVNAPKSSANSPVTLTNSSIAVDDPKVVLTVADGDLVATAAGGANSISSTEGAISVQLTSAKGEVISQKATEESSAIEVRTSQADGATAGIDYEVLTQVSATQVEKRTVAVDGTETTTTINAVLDNQKQTAILPADLKAPEVKGGLTPMTERDASQTLQVTTTTSTTATTAIPKLVTSTTTVPERNQVDITFNIDAEAPGLDEPGSSGFLAVLTVTNGGGKPITTCKDIDCVDKTTVSIKATGVDPASSQMVTTSLEYSVTKMIGPFEIRCGKTNAWIAATAGDEGYLAKCGIESVTKDETIDLRTNFQ